MSGGREGLFAHIKTGATTTCQAWKVTRRDGLVLGFTDHDQDLSFEGIAFAASSGMTPGVLQQSSGLAVDNTEVMGALSDTAISEDDLRAGRYDGAELTSWVVNWQDVTERVVNFRGTFGEVQFSGKEYRVELRGLTEPLNYHKGRVYQSACSEILGDQNCKVAVEDAAWTVTTTIEALGREGTYLVPPLTQFAAGFFNWGRAEIMSGSAIGQVTSIRQDKESEGYRSIDLMVNFPLPPAVGDQIKITAGCDKSAKTCRAKFNNFLNFRGFPHIPGADWLSAYPVSSQQKDGGSRYK